MKYVQGDLIQLAKAGSFDVIVHGCNCMCTMGAGIAKQIKQHFPEAYQIDQQTRSGDKRKLGTITYTRDTVPVVVNAYTQYDYKFKKINVSYLAIKYCLEAIKKTFSGKRIGMPKIGCGLAGGDWSVVSVMIDSYLSDEDVTVVEYNQSGFVHTSCY